MKTITVHNLAGLAGAAQEILAYAGPRKVFCFYGELGAGKTTLIKEICRQLGATDRGSSPTFSLVNEYYRESSDPGVPFKAGSIIYHFDLYRIKTETEIYDIGYEDYLFSGNYCFIEWPEKIERLLPSPVLRVRIEVVNSERIITVE